MFFYCISIVSLSILFYICNFFGIQRFYTNNDKLNECIVYMKIITKKLLMIRNHHTSVIRFHFTDNDYASVHCSVSYSFVLHICTKFFASLTIRNHRTHNVNHGYCHFAKMIYFFIHYYS